MVRKMEMMKMPVVTKVSDSQPSTIVASSCASDRWATAGVKAPGSLHIMLWPAG